MAQMDDIFKSREPADNENYYVDRGMLKYRGMMLSEHLDSLDQLDKLNELIEKPELDEQAMHENLMILTDAHSKNRVVTLKVFEEANLDKYKTIVLNEKSLVLRKYKGMGKIKTYDLAVPVFFEIDNKKVQFEQPFEVMQRFNFSDIIEVID